MHGRSDGDRNTQRHSRARQLASGTSAGPALKPPSMLMRTPTRWARPKLLRPPGFIVPCQPVLAAKVPTGDGWLHELKHDGFRIVAHKDGERVHLWSRNGRDRTGDFVAIADAVRALPLPRIMLDGEAMAHCLDGLPALQPAPQRRRPGERLPLRLRPALA